MLDALRPLFFSQMLRERASYGPTRATFVLKLHSPFSGRISLSRARFERVHPILEIRFFDAGRSGAASSVSEHPYNLLSERVGGRVDLLPHVPDAFWLRLPQFRNEGGRETREHAHGEMAKVSSSPLRLFSSPPRFYLLSPSPSSRPPCPRRTSNAHDDGMIS